MTWLDRILHLLGLAAAGITTVAAASGTTLPKGLAIAAGVTTYVATGAARSFMTSKARDAPIPEAIRKPGAL